MPAEWLDFHTVRGRTLMYLSDMCIVGAGVVFALAVGKHWAWGPFIVGPVVAAAGLGAYAGLLHVTVAAIRPTAEQMQQARPGLRQRHMIVVPFYGSIGLFCGLIAGSLRSYWPDLVLAMMILLMGILLPAALLPIVKRRAATLRANQQSN